MSHPLQHYWYLDSITNSIFINLKVKAGAKINKIIGLYYINNKSFLYISINTIPENNKANQAIIKFLSQWLEVCRSNIKIVYGLHSNLKVISVINTNANISNLIRSKLKSIHL
ncbi:hypothetical protein OTT_0925 [Orientia tsutsugamushi str. Ikeda]|uniref:UPF0235 protein OTT_0925 n=1 Tax=Orientia tsutsugamushi (strain Ikeda) TaxID=334380 RepID=B3CSI2_ORITI|nr:DUF167 domain-containing protein [Orientia tsutsugamushi]BAG40383.1 hypothetical protein OTT_0925 [Orientia tsutsugamushi str. Ikeda]